MTMPKNIALIGYMGVGKTTVGRALSHELHYGFTTPTRSLLKPPVKPLKPFLKKTVNRLSAKWKLRL